MDDFALNDGRFMPRLGLGTWRLPDDQAPAAVRRGLDVGYRLVDTAAIYGNERGVGTGAAGADELFLTTKLWNDRHGDPEAALDESLALLGTDAVDLYLIHWPVPSADRYLDAWRALVTLREAGRARSIGVSNFTPAHLDRIIDATGVVPAVNQVELHPRFQQRTLRAYHAEHGIVTQSWSPLGQGGDLLHDPAIAGIARARGRSAAQVVLAWHRQRDLCAIPKAADPDHLTDNYASLDLELTAEELAAVDALDSADGRIGPEPDGF